MFILMIILTAFLCGLNNIYVPYQETEQLGKYAGLGLGLGWPFPCWLTQLILLPACSDLLGQLLIYLITQPLVSSPSL